MSAPSPLPSINPTHDQQQLSAQGGQRPSSVGDPVGSPREVFAEDWWNHAKPVIEIHGYFRVRAEMFHNFSLGRSSSSLTGGSGDPQYLWPLPLDQSASQAVTGTGQAVNVCGSNATPNSPCNDKTESGANMRFRLNPEIHISDNLRIMSQIDLLDNLVLGSTPDATRSSPAPKRVVERGPVADRLPARGVQRRLRAGELRAHRLPLDDAGNPHRRASTDSPTRSPSSACGAST